MIKKLHKLLFIIYLFNFNAVFADIKEESKINESSQLDHIHEALDEFTRIDTKNNVIYEQKRREMLDSVETRFYACDPDNDNTLDVYDVKDRDYLYGISHRHESLVKLDIKLVRFFATNELFEKK